MAAAVAHASNTSGNARMAGALPAVAFAITNRIVGMGQTKKTVRLLIRTNQDILQFYRELIVIKNTLCITVRWSKQKTVT